MPGGGIIHHRAGLSGHLTPFSQSLILEHPHFLHFPIPSIASGCQNSHVRQVAWRRSYSSRSTISKPALDQADMAAVKLCASPASVGMGGVW